MASLVPLLLFLIFEFGYTAREQRKAIEGRALARSETVILKADGEIRRLSTVLDALASSGVLKQSEWQAFRARAAEIVGLNPDVERIEVRDRRTGELLVADGSDPGRIERIAVASTAERARFVGYAVSPTCHCLVLERGSATAEGRPLVLTLYSQSAIFVNMMPPRDAFEVSALVGPQGRFIARTLDHEGRFSSLSSTYVRQAITEGNPNGIYAGRTLEGFENYTAFTRSKLTGWSAHLALGSQYLDRPSRRYLVSLGTAALLSLFLAGLLVAFALRQIREARLFSERMQQAQKLEALGQLTGGLAHDFNNLLTPVIGVLDQLQRREGLDARGRKLAAGALASAQRAARLTQQLLAFSRRQRLAIGPVDVDAMLEQLAEMVARTIGPKHHFAIEKVGDVRCVRSDPTQLELALLNLAINARDASPDGGRLWLRIERKGEKVHFAFGDEGIGMDAETKRRAFEPFFTTKGTGRGTGLGLAQVFGLAEQSGGTVEIDSEPGAGTVVTLRLPACHETDLVKTVPTARPAAMETSRPLRLLVVDDEPDVRAVMAQTLADAGHAVDAVANGTSALAAVGAEPFDLVISDYAMPLMSGAELIIEARHVRPEMPFLLVTGFADSDVLSRTCPATPILPKPFTADQLHAAVLDAVSQTGG
ncbi:ATP-binding protein [Sphingomonas sp. LHG3406-1]|uniref:ATP-binding protein n=1 Tax=Sphingomonas sp. LHG3406-1 TaxID=2804617 RepID=UPI002613361E|nr:ATP-binding protein [Sphingomonas sp. LHG3406-1]